MLKSPQISEKDKPNVYRTGIYKLYHIKYPDKLYIGSTAVIHKYPSQCGFYKRWHSHSRDLITNKHSSKHLQNVINKYGTEGLRFEIVELCQPEECLKREQYYLDLLKPTYNSQICANHSWLGTKQSAETREKRSKLLKGIKTGPNIHVQKKIYQYDKLGVFIKKFDSIDAAEKETKINRASISKAAKGTRPSAGNYLWSFDDKHVPVYLRKIEQRTLKNEYIAGYSSLEEIKVLLNLTSSTAIRNCFKGLQKQAYGYRWIEVINNRK